MYMVTLSKQNPSVGLAKPVGNLIPHYFSKNFIQTESKSINGSMTAVTQYSYVINVHISSITKCQKYSNDNIIFSPPTK